MKQINSFKNKYLYTTVGALSRRAVWGAAMAGLVAGGAIGVSGFAAQAQEAGAEDEAGIEEIIVTSRKREERIQDVPISISAYSAADLEAKSLTSLKELGQFTTNFNFFNHGQTGGNSVIVFMRGVGQVDPNTSFDPGIGLYLDGVYLGRMQGGNLDLGDMERIEVLRGPQGTLFGKNTIGGAVNMVSAKPTDEMEGYAEITVGEYDRIDARASINVPLVPGKLAAKFTGATRNRDGHGTRFDIFTGDRIDEMGDRNSVSGRALINWTPSENVNVLFSFDGMRARETGPVRKVVQYAEPMLAFLLNMFVEPDYGNAFLTDSDFTSFANELNANDVDLWGLGMTVDWDLGDWSVKSITSYRDLKTNNGVDPDGSIYTVINQQNLMWQDQFSQELQLSGISFDDRLNWVAGLYYFQEDGLADGFVDVYAELYNFIGLDIGFHLPSWIDNKSYSAFGQGTYNITEQFSVTAGLRFTHDKKNITREYFRQHSGAVLAPLETQNASWDAVTGRLGFEYQWNDDVMTYASAARGYKGGGINPRGVTELEFVQFDPEFIWTYEVGLRSDWADRRVRFNASLYYSDYKDIQFSVVWADENAVPIMLIANAAKSRVKGFEADLIVAPAPGLNLSAGVGLTDAEYTQADPTTGITVDSVFVKTPKWSVTLAGEYVMPIGGWGELTARVDYRYKSKIYHDAANSPIVVQDGYGIVNARLSLEDDNGNWTLSVFGTNIGNTHYILAGTDFLPSLGFAEVQYARPSEWGASLKYNF